MQTNRLFKSLNDMTFDGDWAGDADVDDKLVKIKNDSMRN